MSCDCKGDKTLGEFALKVLLCTKTNQCFVLKLVEKILPVLFWVSVVLAIIFSFRVASMDTPFGYMGFSFGALIFTLFITLLYVLIVFYFLYALKAIKDILKKQYCTCGDGDSSASCEMKTMKSEVKKDESAANVRKKPGPKKGSTRGRKKAL